MQVDSIEYEGNMEEQGGGHGRICKCKVKPGDIQCISKPLDHREGSAYESLQKTPLKDVIPTFYGIHDDCIIIDDITAGMKSPCMADFKVGTRHYDPDATPEKISGLIEKQKGSTTDSHGVRLIDGKIRKDGEVSQQWDRKQGLKFTLDEFSNVVHEFVQESIAAKVNEKLVNIKEAFEGTVKAYPGFRMYASSVLIAYDGDNLENDPKVVLIDFAHTHMDIGEENCDRSNTDYDDGVVKGVQTLIDLTGPEAKVTTKTVDDKKKSSCCNLI